jgi:hypothetical protein
MSPNDKTPDLEVLVKPDCIARLAKCPVRECVRSGQSSRHSLFIPESGEAATPKILRHVLDNAGARFYNPKTIACATFNSSVTD